MTLSVKNIVGILLILCGIGYFLNVFNIIDFRIGHFIATWYPMLIVLLGLHFISNKKFILGSIFALFGIILLFDKLNIFDINVWKLVFPFALIGIGVNLLASKTKYSKRKITDFEVEKNFDINNIFSSDNKNISSSILERGEIFTLFGSTNINMALSEISEDNFNLELTSIFGNIEIRLPKDCRIEIKGTPIFGSIEDNTIHNPTAYKKVILDCTCVFGNIEISN